MSTQPAANTSPLKQAFLALERTQAKLEALERAHSEPIAILGLGCRLPGGVQTPADFWRLLAAGQDAISEVPPDRWSLAEHYDADPNVPGKMYSRFGGFLDDIRRFDADFFGISPREAASLDPQQRLLLETSWEALESAALPPDQLDRSPTGVYVGISSFDYAGRLAHQGLDKIDAYVGSGNCHSTAAGRLSYTFGLQGPCIAIDTACSSSLVAVHLACQALRAGECSLALAGGVNALLFPILSINFAKARMLSPDGRCKTFDAAADGYVRGEGAGMVVLKRLGDALAAGDPIMAVIRGSAVNQDGPSGGLTVPNGPAQEAVIRRALAMGQVKPEQVSYLEAHGTGTQLGDPIELGALSAVFGGARPAPLCVGSVKTNIGHLESSAGIAGLIKVVLMLQQRQIPPHLHFRSPNPKVPWQSMPIRVSTALQSWDAEASPRIAGVSSFGFSGTNAHVIVEEAPPLAVSPATSNSSARTLVLPLSAKSEAALDELCLRVAGLLESQPGISLAHLAYTLSSGRSHFAERVAVTANTTADAACALRQAAAREPSFVNVRGRANGNVAPLASDDCSNLDARAQAQFYVEGGSLQPDGLFPAEDHRKLHLPTYPFQRREYWIDEPRSSHSEAQIAAKSSALEHPLLGAREPQAGDQTVFERVLPAGSLRFLADHRIGSTAYLPASAYLELALAAAKQVLPLTDRECIAVSDVELRRALPLRDEQPLTLKTVISPNDVQLRFELLSQRTEDDARPAVHAAGIISVLEQPRGFSREKPAASGNEIGTTEIYERFQSHGLNYGPAFRALTCVYVDDQQVYCEAELPDALRSEADAYLLHPVLLDACLQGLGAKLHASAGGPVFLPVHVDRLTFLSPTSHSLCSQARIRPAVSADDKSITADVELFTSEGQSVAILSGIRFQPVTADMALSSASDPSNGAPPAPSPDRERLLAQLKAAEPDERRGLLLALLQQKLALVLRRDAVELPDPAANLFQLGMDSLLAVEFIYEVNRSLGIRLPAETLLTHSTLTEFVGELPKHLDASNGSPFAGRHVAVPSSPWIAYCRPKADAAARLFCFHHLGGTASLFADWAEDFPDDIEVFPVQLPGRESRQNDPPITDFWELIESLAGEMLEYLDRPFAFFGNSGGSLVAFELAQRLRRRFGLQPDWIFAGGLWPPHLVADKTAGWTDANIELLGHLGVAAEQLSRPIEESASSGHNGGAIVAAAAALAPHVRFDLQLFSSYQYESRPPLDCPITAFLGRDDELVAREEILEWGRHTNSGFRLEMFPGAHSTWHAARRSLVRAMVQDLAKSS